MLSEDTIDKLLLPFIRRQEKLNMYVISIIAKRIMSAGKLSPSDIYALQRLYDTGSDIRLINEEIARVTALQVSEVKALIKEVAINNYISAKPLYDYRHKSFIPYDKNKPLQRIVEAVSRQTAGTFTNMSRATAFMLRDPKNRQHFIPTPLARAYQQLIDESVQTIQMGFSDPVTELAKIVEQLGNSGLRYVSYDTPSGRPYTQRLETAVRRNLNDGVRAINQGVQDLVGEETDSDGKEISVHINAAPDHEPVQGRQFTNEEYDKLQSTLAFESYPAKGQTKKSFAPIERAIGTWNCRHFTYSVILGITKPNYTGKQLDEMAEQNKKGYTTPNGIHLTMYECTQMQRKYENAIRKAKDLRDLFNNVKNADFENKYKAQVKQLMKEYVQFSRDCGLKPKYNRL